MTADDNLLPEKYHDRARHLLEALVGQPSISAQGFGIQETADLVESMLADVGFTTQRFTYDNVPPAIFAEQRGTSPFTVLLYNHYDVQPEDPLELWETPPFEAAIRDGAVFGRGTSDNKGQIAARLAAIEALRDQDGTLPVTVKWIIEGEEEIGSAHFGELIEPHADLLKADGCLWEGDGFDEHGRPLATLGAKGLLYVELSVTAMSLDAHSGLAPILPSSAWRLVHALQTLRSPDGRILVPGFYDDVLPPKEAQRAALQDLPTEEDEMHAIYGIDSFLDGVTGPALAERASFAPTCNIAGLWSGYSGAGMKTVLPRLAGAKIDFRLVPDQDPNRLVHALRGYLLEQGFGDVHVDVLGQAEPVVTPIDDPFAQRVLAVAEAFAGRPAAISPIAGGSLPLLENLKRHVGVPGLSAPDNVSYVGSGAHGPNEHIRLADLYRGVDFTAFLLRGLAR